MPKKQRHTTYEEYVDSGIAWLGKVPKGWGIEKLKFVAPLRDTKRDFRNGEDEYIGLENIESRSGRLLVSAETMQPESVVNEFCDGDVLFGKLRPYLAKAYRTQSVGVCTSELLVLNPSREKFLQGFLFYRLLSDDLIKIIDNSTYGAKMPRASWNFIGDIKIAVPSLVEQVAVARFLDAQTSMINVLVAKKRRMIDLLKEERAAVIHRAVTRGVDAGVELVESGVPWLGKIPKGWQVRQLRHVAEMTVSTIDKKSVEGEIPVRLCNYVDVYKNDVIREDLPFMEATASPSELKKYRLQKGDVLMTKDSEEWNDIGIPAYVDTEANDLVSGYHLALLRSRKEMLLGRFLSWALLSKFSQSQLHTLANGVTRFGLSHGDIKEVKIAIPALQEQKRVADFIDKKTSSIDSVIEKISRSIDLLTEYRSSLITSVVTGKIKVT